MGVPALFRWLSQKYPKIVSHVFEEHPQEIDGVVIPIDATNPNPNGEEMDNLYLDMNGIVHPCSHPEDRAPPETEEEMMLDVFKYTERVVNMVRPRKLLMIAIDGVAPRAKMNQQRSRRFRSAQEAKEKEEDVAQFIKLLEKQNGTQVDDSLKNKKVWDSNAITPGTPFMDILAASIRYWVTYKMNTDPAWAKLKVIISDSTVPGEGEHKIMEFIRSQRADPDHDPNTRHVIYGLDADLIMLGLATHEPHFRVLREDVFASDSKAKSCKICGQKGHVTEECTGKAKEKDGEFDEKSKAAPLKPFVWLHVGILREYLEAELHVPDQGFKYDLERAIDDWVFMCFFVGNDFLPHLPSLEIRDGGIDTLIAIWKDNLPIMGGYVTKDGTVDLEKVQYVLDGLAKQEDAIFRRRKQAEERREQSAKRRKLEPENRSAGASGSRLNGGETLAYESMPLDTSVGGKGRGRGKNIQPTVPPPMIPLMKPGDLSKDTKRLNHDMVKNREEIRKANLENKSAAQALKMQLANSMTSPISESPINSAETVSTPIPETTVTPGSAIPLKRKADIMESENSPSAPGSPKSDPEMPPDTVRLWEPGYRDRYYEQKFQVSPDNIKFRSDVAASYVEGLCWVLLYYFQGCPSWTWYYPYHYAPFAQDFEDVAKLDIKFEKGTPFKPFEQLMGVLPAASKHNLPEPFQKLMTEEDSEIIDFYPKKFPIDLNGKKFTWQGVALLPFIDEQRLLEAASKIYPKLAPEDIARNTIGHDVLYMSDSNPLYDDVASQFYSKRQDVTNYKLNPKRSQGLSGKVEKDPSYIPRSTVQFPLKTGSMPVLEDDRSMSVFYEIPKSKNVHKSMLLRGVRLADKVLTRADVEKVRSKAAVSGRSYGGAQLYGGRGGRGGRGGGYQGSFQSSRPPPPQYSQPQFNQPYGVRNNTWHANPPAPGAPPAPSAPLAVWGAPYLPPTTPMSWANSYNNRAPLPPPPGSGFSYSGHHTAPPPPGRPNYSSYPESGRGHGDRYGGYGSDRRDDRGGDDRRDERRDDDRYRNDRNDRSRNQGGYQGYGWGGRSY